MAVSQAPIYPAANTLITVNDPTVNSACDRVQIQNGSTFSLTVSAGPGQTTIPPNWTTTLPSSGGAAITILPSAFGSAVAGITLLWLYPEDDDPPDGAVPGTVPGAIFLGSLIESAPGTYVTNFPVPPGVSMVLAYVNVLTSPPSATATLNLLINGLTTGYGINPIVSTPVTSIDKLYQTPIAPAVDQQVTVSFTFAGTGAKGSVWLFGFTGPQLAQDTIDQPLYVSGTSAGGALLVTAGDPTPSTAHTPFNTSVATGTTSTILAAPTAGKLWEVVSINARGGAAAASSTLVVQGLTSTTPYFQQNYLTGNVCSFQMSPGGPVFLSEGLQLVNTATGQTVVVTVIARLVA